ncbi:MAG TPA: glucosyl-3-phosphoglycerate synthase, partial [Candidatus Limnocylindrales bacterium]|nr:glucosyl-3-phosphoglycerate synthase [Candidatus Limnocylindrales bacterium]
CQVVVDYAPMTLVCDEIASSNGALMLVDWAGPHELTAGLTTEMLLERAPCDLVLLYGESWPAAGPVLLPLRGGPNLTLAVDIASTLADDRDVTLIHVLDQSIPQRELANLEVVMRDEPRITRSVTSSSSVLEGIAKEVAGHKAVVLGASLRYADEDAPGTLPKIIELVFDRIRQSVVLVRTHLPEEIEFHAPARARIDEPVSIRVDRWFAQNTFHSKEFADIRALVDLKEQQGLTISLGLPALNEEETVGKVIGTIKRALMDQWPLLDEIVLIDSASTDRTVEIAESMGVTVYRHMDILPESGTVAGKGEALWKSLHVLKGDLIAWIDTDITNIHPRFVYGIIGPLLKHPHLQYIKGFYQRPIAVDGKIQAYGGGRVTELVARPLFNLFYPELSGVIQPLSGEYAGRRTALERVPFFTGYGVETGLLIDILERYGLEAIAQSDLEVRVHHNQPLEDLSRMSFAILQVFIDRIEKRFGTQLLEKANRSLKMIVQEPDRFGLEVQAITDQERPPMGRVRSYRKARATLTT